MGCASAQFEVQNVRGPAAITAAEGAEFLITPGGNVIQLNPKDPVIVGPENFLLAGHEADAVVSLRLKYDDKSILLPFQVYDKNR